MVEEREVRGEWVFQRIGKNHVMVFPNTSDNCITMTGADVTKQIEIPYFHRIVKLVVHHMTSAYADSIDALSVTIELKQGQSSYLPKLRDIIFRDLEIITAMLIEIFGEAFEYEPRTWTLTLNSTSTDKLLVILYIQKEEKF